MIRFVTGKIGAVLVTLYLALTGAFLLGRLSGDPVANILGPFATEEQADALRHTLGLDRPLLVQYFDYLTSTAVGDLGDSLQFYQPNLGMIFDRLPYTLQLLGAGMTVAVIVGVPLGILAATREGGVWDRTASALAVLGQSVPVFWLGMMLVAVFAVQAGLLPAGQAGGWRNLVLPALTMAMYPMAHIARLTRSAMAEVLREPYIAAVRARGLAGWRVVFVHALRNASPPVLTVVALQTGMLLSGAVAVEYVYSWPGLGSLALQAIQFRDFPLVQAIVVVGAVSFVVINLIADLLYAVVDPRLR
ncbi:ABC transporter permease [Actinocorallia sp. A-T 12471]|uniref:ABC transporter permease n=1 Tax=Actinocorallia sp. A-T 12471 TaxID=3089813 RepID=UPI0029CB4359|nr:ABC transporter permease [Actinocorallia sp. A-T 12471]MDX6739452.1 ABC transporter permease [Actinocorallia sp. A-T 12471]